jgi:hypothetical protein
MYWRAPPKLKSKKILQSKQTKRHYMNQDCLRVEEGEPMRLFQENYRELLISKGGNELQIENVWKIQYSLENNGEWYSPLPIMFKIEDVGNVMFMTNVSDYLVSSSVHKIRDDLKKLLGPIYVEDEINDPILDQKYY